MRASAQAAFYPEMKLLEGYTTWLYFDTRDLATTGVGNMIDAGSHLSTFGRALPWRKRDGSYATEAEIDGEYTRLEALNLSSKGGYAYQQYATLHLDEPVVQWMFDSTADQFETTVEVDVANWTNLYADAQLAVMSMAWNLGPSFLHKWPTLSVALTHEDYLLASDNCQINAKPSERNRRNQRLFLQAARAKLVGADRDTLWGTDVVLSTAKLSAANPKAFSSHAWWTQALLRITGQYTYPVDGLFGAKSMAAWRSFSGSSVITKSILTRIATVSAIGVEVVA